ncbi:MAG: HAD family hydrolase [Patescibacteria group bacterium]
MIKAVLFDVDGVLLDSLEYNANSLADVFKKAGYEPITVEQYKKTFHFSLRKNIKHHLGIEDEAEIDRVYNIGTGKRNKDYSSLRYHDGIKEVHEKLADDYLIGLVTSRYHAGIFDKPGLKDLKEYYSVVVGYEDTSKHKPDPEPLLLACAQMNVNPAQCVYVGDALTDIQAAKSAGMKSILFAEKNTASADACASKLIDLPAVIKKLR